MKKNVIILFIVMFAPSISSAQQGWFKLNSGVNTGLNSVKFLNNDTGVCNGSTFVLRTIDGGITWHQFNNDTIFHKDPFNFGINKLFVTEDNSIIAIGYGFIARSTDIGATWIKIPVDSLITDDDLVDISFPTQDTGYIVGINYYSSIPPTPILRTTNQGKSWNLHRAISIPAFTNAQFRTTKMGLAVVSDLEPPGSHLTKTTDGGITWSYITTPFDEQGVFGLSYTSAQSWYLWDKAGLLHSPDDGANWDTVDNIVFNGLGLFNSLPQYRVGDFIIKSTDGGEKWFKQAIDLQGQHLYSVDAPSENIAYAVGSVGVIYKTIDGGGPPVNSIKNISEISKLNIVANRIITSADFKFPPLNSPQEFHLFDLLGRELLRREVAADERSLHVDMHQYPPGIYFARLRDETVRFVKL